MKLRYFMFFAQQELGIVNLEEKFSAISLRDDPSGELVERNSSILHITPAPHNHVHPQSTFFRETGVFHLLGSAIHGLIAIYRCLLELIETVG